MHQRMLFALNKSAAQISQEPLELIARQDLSIQICKPEVRTRHDSYRSNRGSSDGFRVDPADKSAANLALRALDLTPVSCLYIEDLQALKVPNGQRTTKLGRLEQKMP